MTNEEVALRGSENITTIDPAQLIGSTTLDWDALITEIYKLKGIERQTKRPAREPNEDELEEMARKNEEEK
jgi:hypothetical protein